MPVKGQGHLGPPEAGDESNTPLRPHKLIPSLPTPPSLPRAASHPPPRPRTAREAPASHQPTSSHSSSAAQTSSAASLEQGAVLLPAPGQPPSPFCCSGRVPLVA